MFHGEPGPRKDLRVAVSRSILKKNPITDQIPQCSLHAGAEIGQGRSGVNRFLSSAIFSGVMVLQTIVSPSRHLADAKSL
mmetsp:Transcript_14525/g.29679  ORF Transcript_14525/g.29679 Transcript_14525/m.29679 type:complete len:80 (-) Transcript_14525:1208-1447(-)